ncbi:MAG: glycosyltransferase family 4 protein [bacterium]
MKKLLFVTPELPYPPDNGGKVATWMLLKHLSTRYNLNICLFIKSNAQKTAVKEFADKLGISINQIYFEELNLKRNVGNLILSYKNNIPLTVYRHFSKNFKNHIEKIIDDFDIAFIDYYSMAQYITDHFKGKKIIHTHNAEYIMWQRKVSIESNPIVKFLIYTESKRVKNFEKLEYKKFDKVLCVSSNDVENIKKIGVDENKIELISATGNRKLISFPDIQFDSTEKSLIYIGTLSWEANIDGLIWFIKNCWTVLYRQNPDIRLNIIGASPGYKIKKLIKNLSNVYLTGYLSEEDIEGYYSKSRVFIAPLRFGSGIKVKILNAMNRGIPTVTTSIGAEGIGAVDMKHLCISDTADDFSRKVNALLNQKQLWEQLSRYSRTLMKEKYDWDKICKNINKVIDY